MIIDHFLKKRGDAMMMAGLAMVRDGLIDSNHFWGTINCDGVNSKGEVCGVTTTSGLAWKIPGRVGDSPILGAGLYVDGDVGAAGSTGRGEANLYNTVEKRLLNGRGLPNFGLNFYIVNKKGEHAGVSMYASKFALCTDHGPQTLDTEPLLPGKAED